LLGWKPFNELAHGIEVGRQSLPDHPPTLEFIPQVGVVQLCLKFLRGAEGLKRKACSLDGRFMKTWYEHQYALSAFK
jgi:hypothetical protein